MRILLIHPEDELQGGPWASQPWDRVIDLGTAGAADCARAENAFGCPVTNLRNLRGEFREMRRVRELIGLGLDRLNDEFGLDWWELISILVHQELEVAFLMSELAASIGANDEVHVSRPCFQADILRLSLGSRLLTFNSRAAYRKRGARHYWQVFEKFPASQLLEIFWDKTDPGYQFRGRFSRKPKAQRNSVVLLPSAYVNVSRTALAYASVLPDSHFLLVVTRPSGWIQSLPANVSAAWLRQYSSVECRAREREFRDLVSRWNRLRAELQAVPEFNVLAKMGKLDDFPRHFAHGLEVRDAWRNVLDFEPVQAVICADDTNPYTRIPLLLAANIGLPTIACHHGALDGRYIFKRSSADIVLAKGRMEEDYLVRVCSLPAEKVEVGAPGVSARTEPAMEKKSVILFFSEPYEVAGGRPRSFYRDILPPLAEIARSEERELVIKLHPFESVSERSRLVEEVLGPERAQRTRIVGGPLRSELLNQSWFAVTVLSSVATDCALKGIPCFLFAWLEPPSYGYVDQFTRFQVGIRLGSPAEIQSIPATLNSYRPHREIRENCWVPMEASRLRVLLGLEQEFLESRKAAISR
jgi:hypothetical protein